MSLTARPRPLEGVSELVGCQPTTYGRGFGEWQLDGNGDVILYARTAGGDGSGLAAQVQTLLAMAEASGHRPRALVAAVGFSGVGRSDERPDLLAVQALVGEGSCRFVACVEPTRISLKELHFMQFSLASAENERERRRMRERRA